MQDPQKIPRWALENDPSWEKLTDSNQSLYLKWTKKGTNIQAVCSPTNTYCDIVGDTMDDTWLSDLLTNFTAWNKRDILSGGDITKYLSSRYLNPGTYSSSPGFDIIRGNLLKMRKF
jgi:hypothetical protein